LAYYKGGGEQGGVSPTPVAFKVTKRRAANLTARPDFIRIPPSAVTA
jgi:hypothetical protein